ncbi:magnesium transporter [Numidum massiliense]|uniref:magnesium transporter n=1 Tax=Numidum massiliense TaxID=1522315 RepID=UPI0006D537A8|nr:magnesium transporter [Numidum massiliense]
MVTFPVTSKQYQAETAGAIMSGQFLVVEGERTTDDVIRELRKTGEDMSGMHYIHVVDRARRLVGVLSLRELLTAPTERKIVEVMATDVIAVPVDMDQEEVAKIVRTHDFVSIPVVDKDDVIVGIIHVEDIIDVIDDEATEDFHKMAPVSGLDVNVKEASVFMLFRKRVSWLIILVFMNIFSGAGIAHFEDTIEAYISLVFFLPLLVDSGGNAGSQSATLMIRALAVGDVRVQDWLKLFRKEFVVAGLLGVAMGVAVSLIGVFRGGVEIAVVVSLTMLCIVIVGSVIGMSLPFIFSKLKLDPATASAPLITSLCDMTGVLIYFSIATWYLNI